MGELLTLCREVTGSDACLVWLTPEDVEAAEVAPWTELPIWLPPTGEYAGLHDGDVSAAYAAGLTCRPTLETRGRHLGLAPDRGRAAAAVGTPRPRPGRRG
ncbi:MAG: hypothetical protein R2734_02480 [Nocardioides sp.]